MRTIIFLQTLFFTLTSSLLCIAEFPPQLIKSAKSATALVLNGDASGTAFCIHSSGVFVTNAHVLEKLREGSKLPLILNPSETNQKQLVATVLRMNSRADLALLRANSSDTFSALPLGTENDLFETQQLIAFGYPFGKFLAAKDVEYPSISVNVGRVTSLRKSNGVLQKIQLDAQLNPGNSGGPVLNKKGQIIGIVSSGVFATGVNFAIPASLLDPLITAPLIDIKVPEVDWKNRFEPHTYTVKISPLKPLPETASFRWQVMSQNLSDTTRTTTYSFTTPPVDGARVAALGRTNSKAGLVQHRKLSVNGKSFNLADLREIRLGKPATITTNQDEKIKGEVKGLELVSPDSTEPWPLDGVMVVQIPAQTNPRDFADLKCVVADGEKTLATEEATLYFDNVPERAPAPATPHSSSTADLAIVPQKAIQETLTIDLPDSVYDVVAGGGGRYLILHFRRSKEARIFDCATLSLTHTIPLSSFGSMITAGATDLITAAPESGSLTVYDLKTGEKLRSAVQPSSGTMHSLCMGLSSEKAFVVGIDPNDDRRSSRFHLISARTLKPIAEPVYFSQYDDRENIVRASPGGWTFGLARYHVSPMGFGILSYRNGKGMGVYEHDTVGVVLPRDHYIYTTYSGVFTPHMTRVDGLRTRDRKPTYLPSYSPTYFIKVPTPLEHDSYRDDNPHDLNFAVHLSGIPTPLFTYPEKLSEFKEKIPEFSGKGDPLTVDKRFHFLPQLSLLITVSPNNTQLIARRVNVPEQLELTQNPYLIVSSPKPTQIHPGQSFEHQMTHIASGKVTYSLVFGPKEVQITPEGIVSWELPPTIKERRVTIVVLATSDDGLERYQTWQLYTR